MKILVILSFLHVRLNTAIEKISHEIAGSVGEESQVQIEEEHVTLRDKSF